MRLSTYNQEHKTEVKFYYDTHIKEIEYIVKIVLPEYNISFLIQQILQQPQQKIQKYVKRS